MIHFIASLQQRVVRLMRRALGPAPCSDEPFPGSAAYWEQRYAAGGDSGAGSYGKFAAFKARVLNDLFAQHGIRSAIEFGCGDGNQLAALVIDDYLGVDVSAEAVQRCRTRYAGEERRRFVIASDYQGEPADCTLSLDVIYHLVEPATYEAYLRQLFGAARRLVVVYSSNHEDPQQHDGVHVRHREFTRWVAEHAPSWRLARKIANEFPFRGDYRQGSFADFYVFVRAA